MKYTSTIHPNQSRAKGFAIISAIFLLIVLSGLSLALVQVSTTQSITNSQDIQGYRVLAAARAGTEWVSSHPDSSVSCPTFNPSASHSVNLEFDGLLIEVNCRFDSFIDEGNPVQILSVVSTAHTNSNVGSIGYIERQVTAVIAR